jgi:carboxyl-terminal processing protease
MNDESDDRALGLAARRPRFVQLLALCVGLAMGAGIERWAWPGDVSSGSDLDFSLISQAWNAIRQHYVDRSAIQPNTLTYGAISGMVDALGDTGHSAFLTPDMTKQLSAIVSGRLKGIGVEIRMKNRQVVIVTAVDDSPAQHAGLRSGDIIMKVDNWDITGRPLDQVVERISGPVGTSVTLEILDSRTHQLRSVTLVRAVIKIAHVTWQRLPGTEVADLRIASFDDGVVEELRAALREIHEQGLRGLILDLRNNPGGVLDEAVGAASQFLSRGNVLLVKDAQGRTTPVPVHPGGIALHIPTAVLVNAGTASAAEIVAGALRDAHRVILVGDTTFGTGTVLEEFPLKDGSTLLLAVKEWLTPDGDSYWHKGVTPKLEIALPADVNPFLPSTERDMTANEFESVGDVQLLRALKWVSARIAGEPSLR